MVRTTENGGIKLLYNGTPSNGQCTNTEGKDTKIGNSEYYDSAQFYGYMNGIENSKVKETIDTWYRDNILDFSEYLEDAVWCSDLTLNDDQTEYEVYVRYYRKVAPPLIKVEEMCPNKEDRYTVNDVIKGNGKLIYPIALLTPEEAILGGLMRTLYDSKEAPSYLQNGEVYWLLTPAYKNSNNSAMITMVDNINAITYGMGWAPYSVRPSIVLKKDITFSSGNGEPETPYIVDTSS